MGEAEEGGLPELSSPWTSKTVKHEAAYQPRLMQRPKMAHSRDMDTPQLRSRCRANPIAQFEQCGQIFPAIAGFCALADKGDQEASLSSQSESSEISDLESLSDGASSVRPETTNLIRIGPATGTQPRLLLLNLPHDSMSEDDSASIAIEEEALSL